MYRYNNAGQVNFLCWCWLHDSLDPCWEADDGEEETIRVEVLKHSLHRLAVNAEGHAGGAEVQAAAYHIIRGQ